MRHALLAALLWGLVAIPRAWAEEQAPRVEIRVTAEAPKATVGDRLRVRVQVLHPAGITISEPVPIAGARRRLLGNHFHPGASRKVWHTP